MHSRYDERSDPRYSAPRRDDRYAPRSREIERERPAAYQQRERHAPYSSHHPERQSDYHEDRRWQSSTQRPARRYEDSSHVEPRHERRPLPIRQYSPKLPSASYPSRRNAHTDGPSTRYERRLPRRDEYQPSTRSYDNDKNDRIPAAYDTRRRSPPPTNYSSNGYPPRRENTIPSLMSQRALSPIRGELLPTTMKYLKKRTDDYPPSHSRRSPPQQYQTIRPSYPSRERFPSDRREDPYLPRSRGTFRREPEPRPRRRVSQEFEPAPYRPTRSSGRGRGRGGIRGRGGPLRGGLRRQDVSPIRAAGEYDAMEQEAGHNDSADNVNERKRHRLRRDSEDKSRSRSLTPSERIVEVKKQKLNGRSHEEHRRLRVEEEEHQADMLDFDDEIDPVVIERASKAQRRQIQPPDVNDLKLKDTAGD